MRQFLIFSLALTFSQLSAQLGGNNNFDFLASPGSARVSAVGGMNVSVRDNDISGFQQNPGVSNSSMDNQISINHIFHFSGISEGLVSYGYNLDSLDIHLHGGIQYASFGNFQEADEIGNIIGDFKANEVALILGGAKQMNERFSVGINTKFVFASYAGYNGYGLGLDLGTIYQVPGKSWTIGLVAQNIGFSFGEVAGDSKGLPFDLKLGYSNKLKYLPFRYSITYHHLQDWYIRYEDPNALQETDFFGNVVEENQFQLNVDNLFRHLVFAGEFLFGKKEAFNLRFAYNHLRRQELKVSEFRSLGGFSIGFGIKIKRLKLDYSSGYYHLAGATNHIGIRILMGDGW